MIGVNAVRILVTNDDGIFAPGIHALAQGLHRALSPDHELVVVAPLVDHSGAGAAVGPVYERESIPFEPVDIPGLTGVPAFGIDGPPALAVMVACIEGFGERPDVVVSGVNHGANTGRSALHSGTVGAALTASQFGLRGLAVSIAWSADPVPWETPVSLAARLVPTLSMSEPGTVLNLNVPAVGLGELRGVRRGGLARSGLIRSARSAAPAPSPSDTGGDHAVRLILRGARGSDRSSELRELDPASDAGLLDAGWASLTALVGVREDHSAEAGQLVDSALAILDRDATTPD